MPLGWTAFVNKNVFFVILTHFQASLVLQQRLVVFFPVHAELKAVIRLKISPIEIALCNPKVSFPQDENLQLLYRFLVRQISGHEAMCKMELLIAANSVSAKLSSTGGRIQLVANAGTHCSGVSWGWVLGVLPALNCTVHTSNRKNSFSSTELLMLKPADGLQVASCNRWGWGMRGEWAEHVGVIKQPNAKLPSCWKSRCFQFPQAVSGLGMEKWVVGWLRCEPVLALGFW